MLRRRTHFAQPRRRTVKLTASSSLLSILHASLLRSELEAASDTGSCPRLDVRSTLLTRTLVIVYESLAELSSLFFSGDLFWIVAWSRRSSKQPRTVGTEMHALDRLHCMACRRVKVCHIQSRVGTKQSGVTFAGRERSIGHTFIEDSEKRSSLVYCVLSTLVIFSQRENLTQLSLFCQFV